MAKRATRKAVAGSQTESTGAVEAAAFGTTAGTMLLGVLAGAAEARHAGNSSTPEATDRHAASGPPAAADPPGHALSPPMDPADAGAPLTPATTVDHAAQGTPAADLQPTLVTDTDHASDVTSGASGQAMDVPGADISAPTTTPIAESADADTTQIHDGGLTAPHIDTVVTQTLDGAMSTLSHTVSNIADMSASLGATMQSMVTSTIADVGQLADTIGATTANLTQSPLAAPADHGFTPEAGGLVPVAALTAPLHVGFIGQAQPDSHDAHDGAFSALGLNHF